MLKGVSNVSAPNGRVVDLGDFTFVDDNISEISRRILTNLKKRGVYSHNLLYRGLVVTDETVARIIRFGTDRTREKWKVLAHLHTTPSATELSMLGKREFEEFLVINYSPRYIFAAPERDLEEVIGEYAFVEPSHGENSRSVVIAYDGKFLISKEDKAIDAYKFIRNPVDAVKAVFKFSR